MASGAVCRAMFSWRFRWIVSSREITGIDSRALARTVRGSQVFRKLRSRAAMGDAEIITGDNSPSGQERSLEQRVELANLKLEPEESCVESAHPARLWLRTRSPLDWAARQGDTPTMRLLAQLTGSQPRRHV